VRKDKPASDTGKISVGGDTIPATPELADMFFNFKIQNAVTRIKQLITQGR
jgi:hypothetical protein